MQTNNFLLFFIIPICFLLSRNIIIEKLTIKTESKKGISIEKKEGYVYQNISLQPNIKTILCHKPSEALSRAGVEYIEVRCLDINPFEPLGISREQVHFLDTLKIAGAKKKGGHYKLQKP